MTETNLIALFKQLSAKDDALSSKQQAVLNASLLLFSEKGFEQTSTKDIASAAGVSEGTVYKHFKTKNQLLVKGIAPVLDNVFQSAVHEFLSQITLSEKIPTLHDVLTLVISNRVHFIQNNLPAIKVALVQVLVDKKFAEQMIQHFRTAIVEEVKPLLSILRERGEICNISDFQVIKLISSTIISIVVGYQINSHVSLEDAISEGIVVVEKALK
ncbi:MAG: TetR/AcrR family transcriptional regulator [Leuconostoc pseudomesenteroides]|uniref:TetR/AcrR family transcriptional regulator n=1 Tax=Leuconostoc pseudomesenteroides TaxID=33968 RepID=UPI0039E7E385